MHYPARGKEDEKWKLEIEGIVIPWDLDR